MNRLLLVLKGMAMGAADIIPGVSGGTIAFITGIYGQLLSSINTIDFKLLKVFRTEGIKAVWLKINGNFLTMLFAGIAVSILALSNMIKFLLVEYPVLVWAFFFGLVLASIFLMGKQVKSTNIKNIIVFVLGAFIAYLVTSLHPAQSEETYRNIFFSGMIAIVAMILPGISGSFILVILGSYATVLDAISALNFPIILTFCLGALIGLLSFSRLLKWTLDNYFDSAISLLTGFLLGSLNKIWPWKKTLAFRTNRHGELIPSIQKNIWPNEYTEGEPQILLASALFSLGVVIIFILARMGKDKNMANQ